MSRNAAAIAAPGADRQVWGMAGGIAAAAHGAALIALLVWARPAVPPPAEPVMLVELPAEAGPAPADSPSQPSPAAAHQPVSAQPLPPSLPLPQVREAVPAALPVNLPAPAPAVSRSTATAPAAAPAAPAPAAIAPSGAGTGASALPGSDPRAKAAEVDYFSLVSAYLNRRKTYPVEARKAREEGVVVVRFTVDRDGAVTGTAIKRSSGHDLLDQATLALLQRVAPLPRMPSAMQRQTVTLALPIEYSLKTS